jgi:oligoribonuclease NrnB/cAMP/cGMP phosphodiesterase (DHH superfamily)
MIVYHNADPDGWFSAALLLKFDSSLGDFLIGADYPIKDQVFASVMEALNSNNKPKKVYICDFSFPLKEFEQIVSAAKQNNIEVWWFDHHASAIRAVSGSALVNSLPGERNTSISAAMLTAKHTKPDRKSMEIISLVSQFDVYNFDESKFTSEPCVLFTYGFVHNEKDSDSMVQRAVRCLDEFELVKYIGLGRIIVTNFKARIDRYLKDAEFGEFEGLKYALVNFTDKGAGLIAQYLYDKVDFVMTWRQIPVKKVAISFVSAKTRDDVDVSVLAKKICSLGGGSGGGHTHASGGAMSLAKFVELFLT